MKLARDPITCKYRMAWIIVMFDLPVVSESERREATRFRTDLIRAGYFMMQFSVYARPCGTSDKVDTQVRRLKKLIPPRGEVRAMIVTDAQWGRMMVFRGPDKPAPEDMPDQLMFF
jgi:CRISPR-associated protein Cas2